MTLSVNTVIILKTELLCLFMYANFLHRKNISTRIFIFLSKSLWKKAV